LNVSKPATATITIQDSGGQTVYTGKAALNPGGQAFTWNGIGPNGVHYPDRDTTIKMSQSRPKSRAL
jgi:flagellar basal-body rod modification protein FlgD